MRWCAETGHEELVVIAGSGVSGMLPHSLDLTTFTWRAGPWRRAEAHVVVPAARERAGSARIAGKWLLVSEGSPVPVRLDPS